MIVRQRRRSRKRIRQQRLSRRCNRSSLGTVDILAFVERATEDPDLYASFANAEGPAETRALEMANLITGFGSVRFVSLEVMNDLIARPAGVPFHKKSSKLPDWNLDADRGYGYLNWTYDGIGNPPPPWYYEEAEVVDGWDR